MPRRHNNFILPPILLATFVADAYAVDAGDAEDGRALLTLKAIL
jgi:hypothetical protein